MLEVDAPPFPHHVDGMTDECDAIRPGDLYDIADMVATGATAKQVDHWTRGGYLHPVTRENATNGVPRRWPEHERDVCARMAHLVDVGLSLRLAHDVARHPGPYRNRGVQIALVDDRPQVATPAEREILRHPGRVAVAGALRALLDEATAADQLAREVTGPADHERLDRYPVAGLILLGAMWTEPGTTHSDNPPDQGKQPVTD
jgi:hypothetical protein